MTLYYLSPDVLENGKYM